ncbi:Alpha N-terminal protein methyltransferase 1B [Oryzias melastigma]|uniref:Alpha N-terminal protein methyltransferase 1B n=1 Tax=Oryzias melastigma TaxID=30732 RepID=A0A834C3C9_ORYME|nr:Alpha N-terminal protein methyltransferase 1B [Oryzias melastigma]
MNFLIRCKKSLRPNGVIIIKDNMARQGCKLDSIDSSISRHLDIMRVIIAKAGLEVLAVERQDGFPDVIMPVWMVAMK